MKIGFNPILALFNSPDPQMKLFQTPPGTTGIVILVILLAGLLTWVEIAYLSYRRKKQMEQFPAILGDPRGLLDQVCNVIPLGVTDRYLLKKVAFQMRLPQPASLLLSPALLVEAAKTWKKTHRFTPTQNWGTSRLDSIATQIFGKSLDELGFNKPNT
jgi:hypothetical protein